MKKFFNVIGACINALMTLIIIVGIAFLALYAIGIEPYVVQSGSMETLLMTGSLCFVNKHVAYEDVKPGDVIAFELSSGEKVTHRVISINDDGFVTKGDANLTTDGVTTNKDNYIGKTVFSVPKVGYAVAFIQTPKGKIILGTVIVFLLLAAFLTSNSSKEDEEKESSRDDNNSKENTSAKSNEENLDVNTNDESKDSENTEDENKED